MDTLLQKIPLHDLIAAPILFDTNIFMVGIEERNSKKEYSFENMRRLYLQPMMNMFDDIQIHEEVYKELDPDAKIFLDPYLNSNTVKMVGEGGLYGKDPLYTSIFNKIAKHELVNYSRCQSKNRGEVYSLAYVAYHNLNYVCSRDIMVDNVVRELSTLCSVDVVTFDIIVLAAYVYYARLGDNTYSKGLKAIYKRHCKDVIRRHGIPSTLGEYVKACQDCL